ncbi:MAG: butyryl-CoA dehydrogenase [Variibacter sp.]|nr:butyryl-CoA dehydrogenase [Variibacter sp.]
MTLPIPLFPPPALEPEAELLLASVRAMAQGFAARAADYDRTRTFPAENLVAINAAGLNRMFLPEEYGGAPLSYAAYLACLMEISSACASTGLIWATNFHAGGPVAAFGTADQKSRFLPVLAEGGLAALAITEPVGGSNATSMRTQFRPEGDEVVVEGGKCFITNGGLADFYLLFGKWSELGDGKEAVTALIIEGGTPGLKMERREKTIGHRASQTAVLAFESCRVPRANVLQSPGDGLKILLAALNKSRPSVAAHAVGIARAALSDMVNYANTREINGQTLLRHQGNRFNVAELASDLALCEAALWSLARQVDAGARDIALLAAALKMRAGDIAVRAALEAIQLQGGYGYTEDVRAERLLRDAKLMQIGEGTAESLKDFIGRAFIKQAAR